MACRGAGTSLAGPGLDQPIRRTRGTALYRIKSTNFGILAGKCDIDHVPDLPQRVLHRDPLLKIDIVKTRPACLALSAYLRPTSSM